MQNVSKFYIYKFFLILGSVKLFTRGKSTSKIDASQVSALERRSLEKRASRKSNIEALRRKDSVATNSSTEVSGSWNAHTMSRPEPGGSGRSVILKIISIQ